MPEMVLTHKSSSRIWHLLFSLAASLKAGMAVTAIHRENARMLSGPAHSASPPVRLMECRDPIRFAQFPASAAGTAPQLWQRSVYSFSVKWPRVRDRFLGCHTQSAKTEEKRYAELIEIKNLCASGVLGLLSWRRERKMKKTTTFVLQRMPSSK